VPPNPFGEWAVAVAAVAPGESVRVPIPLGVLVQGAITGTIDDGITEHAEHLFAALDEQGPDAWRQTALLLIQYILSGGYYQMGPDGARRYLVAQPNPDPRLPALTAMHQAVAAWIGGDQAAAAAALETAGPDAVAGATRYLFCVAVGGENGVRPDRYGEIISKLCGGIA
jgi:hypothetical protein